jgi:hypothetical protein
MKQFDKGRICGVACILAYMLSYSGKNTATDKIFNSYLGNLNICQKAGVDKDDLETIEEHYKA